MRTDGARFIGATGCKSSSCHGGAGEKRSQYQTWSQKDFHTRAFAILTDARSQRIADVLGISSAQTSNRCTICHSPMQGVAPTRLTRPIDPVESVSCESCHGAAEPWLRGHTRMDWTYAMRVGAGMRDLKNFYVRANTCVACHQNLDADITSAGHPELVFELNRQSIDEPKHWRDADGSELRAWLVGQAVALRELSWKLVQDPHANDRTQWQAIAWLLSKIPQASLPFAAETDFAAMQHAADAFARRAAVENFSTEFRRGLLRKLTETETDFVAQSSLPNELWYRRAQRLVLALQSLLPDNHGQFEALRNDLQEPNDFAPKQFAAHLAQLRQTLPSP